MSDYKISVTPETFPNGMIKLTFTSNGGKFGTDELLDVIKMTPEQLLNILQANEATTSENKALDIDIVSNYDSYNYQYHKDLEECVGKLLDSIDKGKISQRAVMGLRILTNRK
ncbi:hypothetical protein [Flammeovirga agarivorans]|nr:hypothetical protein [Flammeovirga agarivorans]